MEIIIIGSGIAGLNVALRAAEAGHRVTLMTKKKLVESSTNLAQGGIAAVLDQADNFEKHVEDTLKAGAYHNKLSAVKFLVKYGPDAVRRLMQLGVDFASHRGELLLAKEGGHSFRRVAFVGDSTGQAIEKALLANIKKHSRISVLENCFVADLLVTQKTCFGVTAMHRNHLKNYRADAVVLATGGLGQIFSSTTNPDISTGDGYAMGFRAGAKLCDMEFIQFHPTAFRKKRGGYFLLSEALRGEGAHLRNFKNKRFMENKNPMKELAPRDIVSRAVFEELQNGPAFLDMRHLRAPFIKIRFPKIYETLLREGYDLTRDLIPILPAAHYSCGGLEVDLKGETCIKNLYACGEVAWTGVHGANRLASNSLLEAVVFSDQILKNFQKEKKEISKRPKFEHPKKINLSKKELLKISAAKRGLKKMMWNNVSIVRSEKSLQEAMRKIRDWKKFFEQSGGFHPKLWELKNMLDASLLVTEAALKRKKSLGCHFRFS